MGGQILVELLFTFFDDISKLNIFITLATLKTCPILVKFTSLGVLGSYQLLDALNLEIQLFSIIIVFSLGSLRLISESFVALGLKDLDVSSKCFLVV